MLTSNNPHYAALRQYIDKLPVIDAHQHYERYFKVDDAFALILDWTNYYSADYRSAGGDPDDLNSLSHRERYERFMQFYQKSDKTGYARGLMEGLRLCWGVDSIDSYEDFTALEDKLKTCRDETLHDRVMQSMGIKSKIVDIFNLIPYVDEGDTNFSPYCRFVFSLPMFHRVHKKADLMWAQKYIGRVITCLDDYLEGFDIYLKKCVNYGVVGIKDQSAYSRTLAYKNPGRDEAEKIFNDMIFDPREVIGSDRATILGDWLFQYAMRAAAKHDMPVQLHTGHFAGIRNEITKANAAHLIPTIELNQDVRFDLFHGNWPFVDEYIFMGKNYPNVWLNLCWVQAIDPLYCVELMKRAVMTVPHSKIIAFGGDNRIMELCAGFLSLTRDNMAVALSELVDSGWLDRGEAQRVAADWLFNNPNELYRLGFDPV